MKNIYIIERKTKDGNWIPDIEKDSFITNLFFTNLEDAKRDIIENVDKRYQQKFRVAKYKLDKQVYPVDNSWKQTRETCS